MKILLRYYNVFKTLQRSKTTASECHWRYNLTVKTFISLQSEPLFNSLWVKLKKETNTLGIEEPSLPRKRKRNGKVLSGNETQFYCDREEVGTYYKRVYFKAVDIIVACIQDRFNQTEF